jgi:hypothetical protein
VGGALTATAVLSDIHTRGATAVVNDIWNKPAWSQILTNIETGQRQWLKVAVELHPGTDAGSSEMLTSAAGVALLHNPHDVLLRLGPELSIEGICTAPDVDDPRFDTKQKAIQSLEARIAAVTQVTSADVAAARRSCLEFLKQAKAILVTTGGPYG